MSTPIYQVDAFTDRPFAGNPAAVCLLDTPRDAEWMRLVAREMNLSETAFLVERSDGYDLRWFTPRVEVALCGHATLASAHILYETGRVSPDREARFHTRSGPLTARRGDKAIELDFPATPDEPADAPAGLVEALGVVPVYVGRSRFDYLLEVETEEELRRMTPDFARLREVDARGIIVTSRPAAPGPDFVSRFFAPAVGVDEDPVTGSAHCCLGPFWQRRLGRAELVAYQASERGGTLGLRVTDDRVYISGRAVTVLVGELAGDT